MSITHSLITVSDSIFRLLEIAKKQTENSFVFVQCCRCLNNFCNKTFTTTNYIRWKFQTQMARGNTNWSRTFLFIFLSLILPLKNYTISQLFEMKVNTIFHLFSFSIGFFHLIPIHCMLLQEFDSFNSFNTILSNVAQSHIEMFTFKIAFPKKWFLQNSVLSVFDDVVEQWGQQTDETSNCEQFRWQTLLDWLTTNRLFVPTPSNISSFYILYTFMYNVY